MGQSVATKNKAVRQQALRDQLSAQGHVQHVVELLEQLTTASDEDLTALGLQKTKLIIDTKLALIKKYLPDPKQVELSTADENPLRVEHLSTKELEAIIARGKE